MIIKLNRFLIEGFVFELWHDLLTYGQPLQVLRLLSETKLSTAAYIAT